MSLHKFLPTEKLTLKTPLQKTEIIQRLQDVTEPRKLIRFRTWETYTNDYEGEIETDSFAVKRLINYRNSFLPEIKGYIRSGLGGNKIDLSMDLHPLVLGFLVVWSLTFGGVGLFVVAEVFEEGSLLFSLAPIAFVLLLYIIILAIFKYEAKKSKQRFEELWEGTWE